MYGASKRRVLRHPGPGIQVVSINGLSEYICSQILSMGYITYAVRGMAQILSMGYITYASRQSMGYILHMQLGLYVAQIVLSMGYLYAQFYGIAI